MKIVMVHNYYQSGAPSGEDGVFHNEAALLRARGHDVVTYVRRNDDIGEDGGRLRAACDVVWSRRTYRELAALLAQERPDVAHFHNIWYLISPSAYAACRDAGVPVVQTVHNFRFFCVNGLLMRNGRVCEDCLGRLPWRGALRRCFRDSGALSVSVALAEAAHALKGTWRNAVDHYIVLTDFGRDRLIRGGLPAGKVTVKPNFFAHDPGAASAGAFALFMGRLTSEKGAGVLVEAARIAAQRGGTGGGVPVTIAGDGVLRGELERAAKEAVRAQASAGGAAAGGVAGCAPASIVFVGQRSHDEALALLRRSKFLVVPSICYEMFPLACVEAFALGKPVVASRLGALAEIVEDGRTGLLFEPGNAAELADKMGMLMGDDGLCEEMGRQARREFEAKYTAERNYGLLMEAYGKAIGAGQEKMRK